MVFLNNVPGLDSLVHAIEIGQPPNQNVPERRSSPDRPRPPYTSTLLWRQRSSQTPHSDQTLSNNPEVRLSNSQQDIPKFQAQSSQELPPRTPNPAIPTAGLLGRPDDEWTKSSEVARKQLQSVMVSYRLQQAPKRVPPLRKDFQCDQCSKTFVAKRSLQRHINTAHIRKPELACDRCGKVFGSKSSLTTHINTVHLRRKDFDCHICQKAFGEKGALTKHIKIVHLHLKDHVCEHCGKGFGEKGSLTKHVNIVHLLRKDYACDICSKTFGRKSDLNKHVNVVHFHQRKPNIKSKANNGVIGNSCDAAFIHQDPQREPFARCPPTVNPFHRAVAVNQNAMSIGSLVDHI